MKYYQLNKNDKVLVTFEVILKDFVKDNTEAHPYYKLSFSFTAMNYLDLMNAF